MNTVPSEHQRGLMRAAGPGALALLAISIVARLPQAMLSIGLLVHAHRLTGSFAVAGMVSGAYVIATGVGAPLMGRLVDRCGQTVVLLSTAIASGLLLAVVALLPSSAPASLLIGLAAAVGLVSPPLEACTRALLPAVVLDPEALPAAYTFEATAVELTFIFGPPLALGLAAVWSTGGAVAVSGVVLLSATVAFAVQPASRRWRAAARSSRRPGGSLSSPAMRTLVLILLALGAVFGAVEVAVTAATTTLGSTPAAGPLLGIWGAGSLLGGILATRLGGAARRRGLVFLIGGLALGHAALIATTGSVPAIGAVLLLAGAWIAPTTGVIYTIAGEAAPAGTVTEAFAWLLTAEAIGGAIGAALAGVASQSAGSPAAFALAGAAGGLALLVTVVRRHTLAPSEPRGCGVVAAAPVRP
jgi:MFS family permease